MRDRLRRLPLPVVLITVVMFAGWILITFAVVKVADEIKDAAGRHSTRQAVDRYERKVKEICPAAKLPVFLTEAEQADDATQVRRVFVRTAAGCAGPGKGR